LPEFIKKIKKIGYLVKLDTNGSNPEMIEKIIKLKLVDYFAMDLKGPFEKYNKIIGAKVDFKKIKKSAKIIMTSGIDYEFRTTIVPSLLNKADIKKMGKIIFGAEKWFLQKFKIKAELINEDFKKEREPSEKEMKELKEVGKKFVKICEIR